MMFLSISCNHSVHGLICHSWLLGVCVAFVPYSITMLLSIVYVVCHASQIN